MDDVATQWLAAQHAALEAALIEWDAARSAFDGAVGRLDKQRARLPAVSRQLKMTESEVRMQLHYTRTGTRPQGGHDAAAARKWANWTYFRRNKVARDWYAKLTQAEADVPIARARLAAATRNLVALIGTTDAARATGLTPAQVSGLCRGSSHSEGLHPLVEGPSWPGPERSRDDSDGDKDG